MYINQANGKAYIGQTWNLVNRHSCHFGKRSECRKFKSAIKKYGQESFVLTIIDEGIQDQETLDDCEVFFIWFYQTLSPNGYNLREGGDGGLFSEETKKRHQEAIDRRTNDQNWIFANRKSVNSRTTNPKWIESRQRMVSSQSWRDSQLQAGKKRSKDPNWRKAQLSGIHRINQDQEWRERRKAGTRLSVGKAVICVETGCFFPVIADAARKHGINQCTISNQIAGRLKTAAGYHWRYATQDEIANQKDDVDIILE